jgi:hypothetical protein
VAEDYTLSARYMARDSRFEHQVGLVSISCEVSTHRADLMAALTAYAEREELWYIHDQNPVGNMGGISRLVPEPYMSKRRKHGWRLVIMLQCSHVDARTNKPPTNDRLRPFIERATTLFSAKLEEVFSGAGCGPRVAGKPRVQV